MTGYAAKRGNLVTLGTIWALTRFQGYSPYLVKTYESGHWFQGEKEAKKNDETNLVILGTIWTLTRFEGFSIYPIKNYESEHTGRREGKAGEKNAG